MKLPRYPHDAGALASFYEEALGSLGALCERTWHDRLQVVGDGAVAQLWNRNDSLLDAELTFPSADSTTQRDAEREVFPGCPLTFRLTETLRPPALALERVVLAAEAGARPPKPDVAEKLWRAQFGGTSRWALESPLVPAHHFSLLLLARCEIQAIDQHWSIHRLALSLPDGALDEALAAGFDFVQIDSRPAGSIDWPASEPARWQQLIQSALLHELAGSLGAIRERQANYLRRELDRIDDYFDNYEVELGARVTRSEGGKLKNADRLAAAKAEHTRRREDQVLRHEIRILPKIDALLMVAEPAWRGHISIVMDRQPDTLEALFIPRRRQWLVAGK